jgi:hypothetical protein
MFRRISPYSTVKMEATSSSEASAALTNYAVLYPSKTELSIFHREDGRNILLL